MPDTSKKSATRATKVQHDCNTSDKSEIRATRVRHKCYTNNTSTKREKNFHFDNETSESIFSHPYVSYMTNERLQGKEQFNSKFYLLDMHCSHAKMRFISAPQILNFVNTKAISKSYTLDCSCKYPCTFRHSSG